MPGEITSEQLPQLIEDSNQLINILDTYIRRFLIELKSAPNTPEIRDLKKLAENKLHLTEQWKIIFGNADAWPRQKVYVAQVILSYLKRPNFEFTEAVREISGQMKRGETEARQQTLMAATQIAMGMPYLFAQMSGAEPAFKLIFGLDMFGKELTGWERVKAAGETALGAAMVYVPAKYLNSLNVPKTTARTNLTADINIQGTPGPGLNRNLLEGVQRVADVTGEKIVVFGSRQSGVRAENGGPFTEASDLDIGVIGNRDSFNKVNFVDPESIIHWKTDVAGLWETPEKAIQAIQFLQNSPPVIISPNKWSAIPGSPFEPTPYWQPFVPLIPTGHPGQAPLTTNGSIGGGSQLWTNPDGTVPGLVLPGKFSQTATNPGNNNEPPKEEPTSDEPGIDTQVEQPPLPPYEIFKPKPPKDPVRKWPSFGLWWLGGLLVLLFSGGLLIGLGMFNSSATPVAQVAEATPTATSRPISIQSPTPAAQAPTPAQPTIPTESNTSTQAPTVTTAPPVTDAVSSNPGLTSSTTPASSVVPTQTTTTTPATAQVALEYHIPDPISGSWKTTRTVIFDPRGHKNFVKLPETGDLLISGEKMAFQGTTPWVNVTGEIKPDGSFKATGTGTVAGFANIRVEFLGTFSQKDGLTGDYTMGAGGGLPGNQPITYHITGTRTKPLATTGVMKDFTTQLVAGLRANNAGFLFTNLHPAALNLYGAPTCQKHFQQRQPDPTYNIEVLGLTDPAAWSYAPSPKTAVSVADIYTVNAKVTQQGQTVTVELHIGQVGDRLYWFTPCE